jgi:hypothetical protein
MKKGSMTLSVDEGENVCLGDLIQTSTGETYKVSAIDAKYVFKSKRFARLRNWLLWWKSPLGSLKVVYYVVQLEEK